MVLKASQATFDAAVEENIIEFGLSQAEAIEEAIKQLKSQGLDISEVRTNPENATSNSTESIASIISNLSNGGEAPISLEETVQYLALIREECNRSVAIRVAVSKLHTYDTLLSVYSRATVDSVRSACLETLVALMIKQPDLLTEKGIAIMLEILRNPECSVELKRLALKWCRECCIMHEVNRQSFVEAGLIDCFNSSTIFGGAEGKPTILKEALSVLRVLILDDDVRVEFGKAHENARLICTAYLNRLTKMLTDFKEDSNIIHDLMLTLSALLVRSEFCKQVEDGKGLEAIKDAMEIYIEDPQIIRQCFKLVKVLAGNDDCKAHIIQKGLSSVLVTALQRHNRTIPTVGDGLKAIAALTLRSPENSRALFEVDAPAAILDIMRLYPEERAIQKSSSWAIRNMVSRSRYQNQHFIELGAEHLLKSNLQRYKDFEYDTKAALRDLECSVELKEEWTGKGGKLNTSSSTTTTAN